MYSETKSNEEPNLLHIQANLPEQAFPAAAAAQSQCLPSPQAASPTQGPLTSKNIQPICLTLFSQTLTNTNTLTVNPGYPAFC